MSKATLVQTIKTNLGYPKEITSTIIDPETGEESNQTETVNDLPKPIQQAIEDTIDHIKMLAEINGPVTFAQLIGGTITGAGGGILGPVIAQLIIGAPATGQAALPPTSIK